MKILLTSSFYPPYHVGGADTMVKYFAEQLVKEGHEVHVLFTLDGYRLKRPYSEKETDYKGVNVHALSSPIGKLEPVLNYSVTTQNHTLDGFKKLVEKEGFDVVHHHNISLLGYAVLKKFAKYRNFYTAHDFWLVCPKYDLYKFGKICERKICLACAPLHGKPYPLYRVFPDFRGTIKKDVDGIIAPSAYMKERVTREFDNEIEVIYNFVPEPPKKIDQPKEKNYFLFVGQLERHKGILQLIDTFKGTSHRLLIFGKGSLEAAVKNKIENEKISNVNYKGWASTPAEILGFMKNANALIMPSLWAENNPMVALEAFSVGTPVIGTKNGGLPEIIGMVDEKLFFDSKNFGQLRGLLNAFNGKRYPKAKLRSVWREKFSWQAHKKGLERASYFG